MQTSTLLGLAGCLLGTSLFMACDLLNIDKNNKEPVPSGFSYSTNALFYAPGSSIANDTPTFETGTAHHFSITPQLPPGLSLDTGTGVISGTPTAEAAGVIYVVTAKSDTVALAASVSITISHWIGLPVDTLQNAAQLLVRREIPVVSSLHGTAYLPPEAGNLYVADRSATHPGIFLVDTATSKIRAFYSEQLPPSSMAFTGSGALVVTETNYAQGAVSVFNSLGKTFTMSFGSDNAVVAGSDRTYLMDHTTGAVTAFGGDVPNQSVSFNPQTGANSDPYDITNSNNHAYITRYNLKSLLILDATQLGGGTRDSIDLSQFSSHHPSDTVASAPRMAWVTSYNGYVFVALQRLNYKYMALDTSVVVVLNSAKQIVATIPLKFRNPIAAHVVGSTWYLTGIANYDQSGGVEKIDLAQRVSAGSIVTAQSLSADVFDFAPTGDHSGYIAYSTDYGYTTKVKKVTY